MRPGARWCGLIVAVALVGVSCGDRARDDDLLDPAAFASSIDLDQIVGHLGDLQRIANENDGNRAAGTQGYEDSVDYVASTLRAAGFDVTTPEFKFSTFDVASESLTAGGTEFGIGTFGYSPATPPEGLTARVVAVPTERAHGCVLGDYDGTDVRGAIVVLNRGECTFTVKEQVATAAGAAAVLVAFDPQVEDRGTLGEPNVGKIPIARISAADVPALVAAAGDALLRIDATATTRVTRNVIAQTTTGSTDNVVMVGAHLDSVPEGPGINDNGSGAAAILDIATTLGPEPNITNAVRFAWWGGEELGLLGSDDYVANLTPEERGRIALYLNFDMLGSPNAGYLTYDGDNSDETGAEPGPEGSAGIERTFNAYLLQHEVIPAGTDFDGRSDYDAFVQHGIPSGGVFSGAEEDKSPDQQRLWGGVADQPFDANYHRSGDSLANINVHALELNSRAAAWGVATYAVDITGPDGVPGYTDRDSVRGDDE